MAHRTNVTQVLKGFETKEEGEMVQDPSCGRKMLRKEVRHMLYRPDRTYYFCSMECEQEFISPRKGVGSKKKAA